MTFLGQLAENVASTYSIGDNTNHTLNSIDSVTGKQIPYGSLGDLSSKLDQSAQRKYVEEGYLKRDPYNTDVKQFEILMQQPSATLLFKKRMYTSVAENFRTDFMDKDEKIYYRAMNVLFQNKCNQISALEKLSKIQNIVESVGQLDTQLMPIIFTLTDTISDGLTSDSGAGSNFGLGAFSSTNPFFRNGGSDFIKIIDRVRKIYAFNTAAKYTSWITDPTNIFQSQLGKGTGVIEITNFTGLNTSLNVDSIRSSGNFSVNIADPYQATLITEWDIEKAISDATNMFYNSKTYQFGKSSLEQVINDTSRRLAELRQRRRVSPINLKINPNTILGKRVTAILERSGTEIQFTYDSTGSTGFPGVGGFSSNSVMIPDEYLKGGILGLDGLDSQAMPNLFKGTAGESEVTAFKALITAVYSKIQLEANSQNAFQMNNELTNYARRKLRANFSGQSIIQPMDTVHIYMSTKSRYDNKLLSGLNNMFTGNGILQNLNKTATDFRTTLDLAFNPSNLDIQAEKAAYVGADFPNYLWAILRTQFITEHEGTHVFGGVVNSARDTWSEGRYMLSVSGVDNTYYFDQGKVNFQPGADNFNGTIFDPLTPFKTNFDTVNYNTDNNAPVLLDENKFLLSPEGFESKNTIVKFKFGPYAGSPATDNTVHDQSIDPISGRLTKTYYAPDGLVYKWKEGIGVFVQFGSSLSMNDPSRTGTPGTYKEPFAGQDVMNVLSLLITGQPYNFANYWKTAVNLYGFSNDPQNNQNSVHTFLSTLREDLKKTNALWGNFLPFKNLAVGEAAFAQALQTSFDINKNNTQIENNLRKVQDLDYQAKILHYHGIEDDAGSNPANQGDLIALQAQKDKLLQTVTDSLKENQDKQVKTNTAANISHDPTYDYSDFSQINNPSQDMSDPQARRLLRRQMNHLTRRMSYNVRANEDKNLFIVDDYYDKDYDILAYDQAIQGNINLYNNTFMSVRDKIRTTADLLNLEVFCDTQGHIRARPPQYNRMPSSIFQRMIYLKQAMGIQIFPDFLTKLFYNQLDALKQRLEILEDWIRLDCAVLSNNDDQSAIQYISTSGADDNNGGTFAFISTPDGNITSTLDLVNAANPDQNKILTGLQDLESAIANSGQMKPTKPIFSDKQRYNLVIGNLQKEKLVNDGFAMNDPIQFNSNDRINQLISRIQLKSGQRVPKDHFTYDGPEGNTYSLAKTLFTIDIVKVTSELASKIRERQKILKLFDKALKNAIEFRSLDDKNDNTSSQILHPGLFSNKEVPQVFEHMIEDELYDDYGPGSGTRYLIKRAQIKNITMEVHPPDYNYVEVHGYINTFASSNEQASGLDVPGFGNGLTTAVALDYDSWRSYGFKPATPITVPFLNDPNTQCAPYAAMLLSRARKNILRGSITIAGNEYMQPGEVVYIEDRGMLFYVESVAHNFTYSASGGGQYTTQLGLSYGHTPGDYIPTTMDIIGKLLYNNRDVATYAVQRQSSASNDINLGALLLSDASKPSDSLPTQNDNTESNPIVQLNTKVINNILFTAVQTLNANNNAGRSVKAEVQLRVYKNTTYKSVSSGILQFAQMAQNLLQDDHPTASYTAGTSVPYTNPSLGKGNVTIVEVDMDADTHSMSPSQKAIDLARSNPTLPTTLAVATSVATQEHDSLAISLFNHVVDCWITFKNIEKTPSTKGSG